MKLNFLIWPSLVYSFQSTPLDKLPVTFLRDIDKMIKSALKEILELPSDIPDSMLFSSPKVKGLGLFKASWEGEAFIQNFNICKKLHEQRNPVVEKTRNLEAEAKTCLKKLNITNEDGDIWNLSGKKIRERLRDEEFKIWKALKQKGRGVELFDEYTPANSWVKSPVGLSNTEWIEAIKMTGHVSNVRGIPGRSQDGYQCRHCTENESLAHVLGSCPYGGLLRITRHNKIRSIIAKALPQKFEVYEEIKCTGNNDSNRRIDILAIDRQNKISYIIDPTIRFEIDKSQPTDVDKEKKDIYNPTRQFFMDKYKIDKVEVIGLFIGTRGTISKFFMDFAKKFSISKKVTHTIVLETIKYSVLILRHHLYTKYTD